MMSEASDTAADPKDQPKRRTVQYTIPGGILLAYVCLYFLFTSTDFLGNDDVDPMPSKTRRTMANLASIPLANVTTTASTPAASTLACQGSLQQATSFRYLHIPKCGTSFFIVLRNYLPTCKVKHFSCLGKSGGSLPNQFFLHKSNSIAFKITTQEGGDPTCNGTLYACNLPGLYHEPFNKKYLKKTTYVSMLREPFALLNSRVRYDCGDKLATVDYTKYKGCLDRFPLDGFNIMTRSLVGFPQRRSKKLSEDAVDLALNNLRLLDYFGLTDRWVESVCLFHATFGGEPYFSEVLNTRKNPTKDVYLEHFKDELEAKNQLDILLYAQAKTLFEQRLSEKASCPEYVQCMERLSNVSQSDALASIPEFKPLGLSKKELTSIEANMGKALKQFDSAQTGKGGANPDSKRQKMSSVKTRSGKVRRKTDATASKGDKDVPVEDPQSVEVAPWKGQERSKSVKRVRRKMAVKGRG